MGVLQSLQTTTPDKPLRKQNIKIFFLLSIVFLTNSVNSVDMAKNFFLFCQDSFTFTNSFFIVLFVRYEMGNTSKNSFDSTLDIVSARKILSPNIITCLDSFTSISAKTLISKNGLTWLLYIFELSFSITIVFMFGIRDAR